VREPDAGHHRALRVGVVASVGVALTLCGHRLAGGGSPDLLATSVALIVAVGVTTALLRRERHLVAVVGVLMGVQVVEHLVLATSRGTYGMQAVGHGAVAMSGGGEPGAMRFMYSPPSLTMLVGHGLAALLVAWVVTRGEQALRAVASLLWRPRPRPSSPLPTSTRAPATAVVPAWLSAWPVADERRRGPPARTCPA
jgi:hypothetical protein